MAKIILDGDNEMLIFDAMCRRIGLDGSCEPLQIGHDRKHTSVSLTDDEYVKD